MEKTRRINSAQSNYRPVWRRRFAGRVLVNGLTRASLGGDSTQAPSRSRASMSQSISAVSTRALDVGGQVVQRECRGAPRPDFGEQRRE